MFRLLPAGSGGAGTAGRGNRMAARAAATLCSLVRFLPAAVPSAARPAAAPLEIRNHRRAGQRDWSGLSREEGAGPARTTGQGSRGRGRSGGASAPAGMVGPGGVRATGEPSLAAARASQVSATAPVAAPTRVGTTYPAVASGLVRAAAKPRAAKTASPARPKASRRTAIIPTTAAYRARITRMPPSSAVLSLVPNAEMAKSLTCGGVRSMAAWPTESTGELCGTPRPAAN